MYLKELSIRNLRNCEESELALSNKLNCLIGLNGAGKTNVLDAVYFLCMCKSYFNPSDQQLIKFGETFFTIKGNFINKANEYSIFCSYELNKKKTFKNNQKEYSRLSDHIGLIPAVMISPADSLLISESGESRRRFVDAVISQFDAAYLETLMKYNKTVAQRNKVLKLIAEDGRYAETLDIYNSQLSLYGTEIYEKRKLFITDLMDDINTLYAEISDQKEDCHIEYHSSLHEYTFDELLQRNAERDRVLQYTSSGVHKDDLGMLLNSKSIKQIGSQGQQKTFLVALKLAQYRYVQRKTQKSPLLLLDDVFDKFDQQRVENIISIVSGDAYGQIFISDTNMERLTLVTEMLQLDHCFFDVDAGMVNSI